MENSAASPRTNTIEVPEALQRFLSEVNRLKELDFGVIEPMVPPTYRKGT